MQADFKKELLRKGLHLSSFWMVLFLYFYPPFLNAVFFGSLFVIGFSFEYGYHHKIKVFYPLYKVIFERMLREKEKAGQKFILSGGVWMLLAAFFCSILFTPENAAIAFSIMLLSDTAASLAGKKFGKTKICGNKSLQGSLAGFFIACLTVIIYGINFDFTFTDYAIGFVAALGAVITELYTSKLKLDDNLSVTLVAGAIFSLRNFVF